MNNNLNKTYKYQLIYPKVGAKIYKTSSIKKGIKRCYEEFKDYALFDNSYDNFVVLNVDTNELYKFKYDHKALSKIDNKVDDVPAIHNIHNTHNTHDSQISLSNGDVNVFAPQINEDEKIDEKIDEKMDEKEAIVNIDNTLNSRIDNLESRVSSLENIVKHNPKYNIPFVNNK
jgi:hypothetical protein